MADTTTDVDSDDTNARQLPNKRSEQERQTNVMNILKKKLIASEAASVLKEQNLNCIDVSASVETKYNEPINTTAYIYCKNTCYYEIMLITFFQLSKRKKVTIEKTPNEKRVPSKDVNKVNYKYTYI